MKSDTDIIALRQPESVDDPLTEIARDGAHPRHRPTRILEWPPLHRVQKSRLTRRILTKPSQWLDCCVSQTRSPCPVRKQGRSFFCAVTHHAQFFSCYHPLGSTFALSHSRHFKTIVNFNYSRSHFKMRTPASNTLDVFISHPEKMNANQGPVFSDKKFKNCQLGRPRFSNHFRQKPMKAASASRGASTIQSRHSLSKCRASHPGATSRAVS